MYVLTTCCSVIYFEASAAEDELFSVGLSELSMVKLVHAQKVNFAMQNVAIAQLL